MTDNYPRLTPEKTFFAIVLVSAAVGATRFFILSHPLSWAGSYEALAHLWVGGLIGAALATKEHAYWFPVAVLSAVELLAAFLGRLP
jgi:hypothetical protein